MSITGWRGAGESTRRAARRAKALHLSLHALEMPLVKPCRLLKEEGERHVELATQLLPVERLGLRGFGDVLPQLLVPGRIPLHLWRVSEVVTREGQTDEDGIVRAR